MVCKYKVCKYKYGKTSSEGMSGIISKTCTWFLQNQWFTIAEHPHRAVGHTCFVKAGPKSLYPF